MVTSTAQRFEAAIGRLEQTGTRRTTARVAVIETLARADQHLSIGEIYRRVHGDHDSITLSTVHRTVGFLLAHEIVHVLAWPREALYGLADGRHSHLVCVGCGQVGEVPPDLLAPAARELQDQSGFALLDGGQTLLGRCPDCRRAGGNGPDTGSWYPGHVHPPVTVP
ncbi:MAG TPA: Fur family transcriptional regulator [Mycobacteriales bacterium]|nr:Fur family transcriptional regulator [Mycobacteriales bacterium]